MIRNGRNIPQMKYFPADGKCDDVLTVRYDELLAFTAPVALVYLPVDGGSVGEKACLNVSLSIQSAPEKGKFSPCVFATVDGEIVDYGLAYDEESLLRFEAVLLEKDGKACAPLFLLDVADEWLSVTSAHVCAPLPAEKPLLGGTKLIQMEPQNKQMMGYVVQSSDGKLLVVDGGNVVDGDALAQQILAISDHVDGWFITHYHVDHVGAVVEVLRRYDITVGLMCYDFADAANPDFIGDGDNPYIEIFNQTVRECSPEKIHSVRSCRRGDRFDFGDVQMTVLNDAYFGGDDNSGNDSGIIFRMDTKGESVLFLGDMGWERGDKLLEDDWFAEQIRPCKVVQMAHHGQEGTTERFYRALKPVVCLYCAGHWLFDVNRREQGFGKGPWTTLETRQWMRRMEVPYTYSSIDGRFVIE